MVDKIRQVERSVVSPSHSGMPASPSRISVAQAAPILARVLRKHPEVARRIAVIDGLEHRRSELRAELKAEKAALSAWRHANGGFKSNLRLLAALGHSAMRAGGLAFGNT